MCVCVCLILLEVGVKVNLRQVQTCEPLSQVEVSLGDRLLPRHERIVSET